LRLTLKFPFHPEVHEPQDRGPLRQGDKVIVLGIVEAVDLYGVIVDVNRGRRKYQVPLCDLQVIEKKSPNYQPVKDYRVWFANR